MFTDNTQSHKRCKFRKRATLVDSGAIKDLQWHTGNKQKNHIRCTDFNPHSILSQVLLCVYVKMLPHFSWVYFFWLCYSRCTIVASNFSSPEEKQEYIYMSTGPFHTEFPFSLCPSFCWKYFFPESQPNIFFLANVLGFHLFSKQEHQLSVFLEIILEVTQTLKKVGEEILMK